MTNHFSPNLFSDAGLIPPDAEPGSVYKISRSTGEPAVIKIISPVFKKTALNDDQLIIFRSEVEKYQQLNEANNTNVVKVIGGGLQTPENALYVESEFVEGPSLYQLTCKPFPPVFAISEVVGLACQLSNALAFCHTRSIFHGGITPHSIIWSLHLQQYILTDFGLSILANEDAKKWLLKNGNWSYTAPEQMQQVLTAATDVFHFGGILYFLLCGETPVSMGDNEKYSLITRTSAEINAFAQALLQRRLLQLPDKWQKQKQLQQMDVPNSLIQLVFQCLQTDPQHRPRDGKELQLIVKEMMADKSFDNEKSRTAGFENNHHLSIQADSLPYREGNNAVSIPSSEKTASTLPSAVDGKLRPLQLPLKKIIVFAAVIIFSCLVLLAIVKIRDANKKTERIIGEYKIIVPKAYLYDLPKASSKREEFLLPTVEKVIIYDRKGDFLFTEIEEDGEDISGWLFRKDVMPAKDWNKNFKKDSSKPEVKAAISAQLANAKKLLSRGKVTEALVIFSNLSFRQNAEAMYYYSNLSLQSRHTILDCKQALDMMEKSAASGFAPAKRTLGMLYTYADDADILLQHGYTGQCIILKDRDKGTRLLMEAMLQGDGPAGRLLEEMKNQ